MFISASLATFMFAATLSAITPQSIQQPSTIQSLDGEWLLATDAHNEGVAASWFEAPRPEAVKTVVPWIIQDAFPGYHGLAWYWKTFEAPANPNLLGRYCLRFWAADYKADVWVNGRSVGGHEGGETPFTLDVTDAIKPNASNLIAVRLLNPSHDRIDGIVLNETPHRNKVIPYSGGGSFDHGGLVDSVELLITPSQRIEEIFAEPDSKTGDVKIHATIFNAQTQAAPVDVQFAIAPAMSGETLSSTSIPQSLLPGSNEVEAVLHVDSPKLWNLNEPELYRVTVRVSIDNGKSADEYSTRCGFRDFRFENGYFRLNGKRLFLRCSHTGNHSPVGLQMPPDPDMLRRDLINVKMMGFNSIRFISGVATRFQLDLCDEIGLMVYEEHFGSWCLADSPKMVERFDNGLVEMIKRDRNHPSITMWGFLNETSDGPVFRHAVDALPLARKYDNTRLIMLNSGRFDGQSGNVLLGLKTWRGGNEDNPNVMYNPTNETRKTLGITWAPDCMSMHPGKDGEFAVLRWTCPENGAYSIKGAFTGVSERATTDAHVLQNGKPVNSGFINVNGAGNESAFDLNLQIAAGDLLDFAIGRGNGDYGADSTGISVKITAPNGQTYDPKESFSEDKNPNGSWSYGKFEPSENPNFESFQQFDSGKAYTSIGSLSNPGSTIWEDVLNDQHPYQRTPHTASVINFLRTVNDPAKPVFISEYGVGSGVDLWRVARHYEQIGKENAEDAQFYRDKLDLFLADWGRWKLEECFASPQDFFAGSVKKMARERLLGLNAIRSNPNMAGHSLTGTVDQGMSGEGLFTTFRELKPGTTDALFEALAPLRICSFCEPQNIYRGGKIRVEAVLANEDVLKPGEYPVRVIVVGPKSTRILDKVVNVTVPVAQNGIEPPFVIPFFNEEITVDGPSGDYRFLAQMEQGGAPLGGETQFSMTDAAEMPPVDGEVVLWGLDPDLSSWLSAHNIKTRPYSDDPSTRAELILVTSKPADGGPDAWSHLMQRVARGASVIFLSPEVFQKGGEPLGWLPLKNKGSLNRLNGWLYHKDEWAKNHPVFEGMQCGGMMDYGIYRDIIPDLVFTEIEEPEEAIAGANNVSCGYSSGLMVALYHFGEGRFLLNSLNIRENLDKDPGAERLLRNMLLYMKSETKEALASNSDETTRLISELGYAK
jgi:hypothetical protein